MAKIKVMYVVHSMGVGGVERLVFQMARGLNRYDIEPVICCLDFEGPWGQELKRDGYKVFSLGRKPGVDLATAGKIKALWKKEQADILHPHQYSPYFYTVTSALFTKRPKIIFTEHGRFFPDRARFKRVAFNQIARNYTDEVVAVCEYSKEALVKFEGFAEDRVKVIYNGIQIEKFFGGFDIVAKRASLGLSQDDKVVGAIGRICPEKNYQMLIKAFAEVKKNEKRSKLVIVGDGESRDELALLARSMNLAADVLFLGERQDASELIRVFDVFAMSSDSEGASLVLLEAMASSIPAVVTRAGGNPELVLDDQTGILVDRNDHKQFSRAILNILGNPRLQKSMQESGRRQIADKFLFGDMLNKYVELYKNLTC